MPGSGRPSGAAYTIAPSDAVGWTERRAGAGRPVSSLSPDGR